MVTDVFTLIPTSIRPQHSLEELIQDDPGPGATVPTRETIEECFEAALHDVRDPKDTWGRPLRLEVRAESGRRGRTHWAVEVLSDGPDRQPGTDDDISTAEPYGAYDARHYPDMDPGPDDRPPERRH